MRRLWIVLPMVFLLPALAPAGAGASAPVIAVVTAVKGKVELRTVGSTAFVRIASSSWLHTGDCLRLAAGATAALISAQGATRSLAGRLELVMRPGVVSPRTAAVPRRVQGWGDWMSTSARSAPMAQRLDEAPALLILSPRNSKCLTGRPVIRWRSRTVLGQ
jgi:hypothetical protein